MKATANIDRIAGLRELQASARAAAQVSIAVIDGPAEVTHPALAGAQIGPLDSGVRVAHAMKPSRAHGTHVASVLFGQVGGPVVGIAPDCRGMLIPIFVDTDDGGVRPCSELDLARALMLACDNGANIINISAGRLSGNGAAGIHLEDAIRHCRESGVLVVAAAGNDGCDCLQVPAALPGVLVVGAMDGGGQPVGFSNWGSAYRDRGVLAPGTEIIGAVPGGDITVMSGTSFATPLVAGTAALLMARQLEQDGRHDARVVMDAIVESADRCDPATQDRCERYLAGAMNVAGAMKIVESRLGNSTRQSVAPGIADVNMRERSQTMNEQWDEGRSPPTGDPTAQSIQAMTDSIQAMQGRIADLGQALDGLRLSGVSQPSGGDAKPANRTGPTISIDGPSEPVRLDGHTAAGPRSTALTGEPITPAACCEACAANEARQLVFALGKLGFDFGTEARMDSIQSQMPTTRNGEGKLVFEGREPSAMNADHLVAFLRASPSVTPAINWTLNLNETPIYAIRPEGYYLEETYEALVDTLDAQTRSAVVFAAYDADAKPKAKIPPPAIERMSLPGIINGEIKLMTGLTVPSIRPARAGMFAWSTEELVKALAAFPDKGPNDPGKDGTFNPGDGLRTFLNRIYEELRNVGLAPQDRALNFAATNAYQANDIFVKIRGRNIHIEKFEVVRSPVMRPDSDCWDVKITFYNPATPTTSPREVYFYTIDVSDIVPVAVGKPRHWTTY